MNVRRLLCVSSPKMLASRRTVTRSLRISAIAFSPASLLTPFMVVGPSSDRSESDHPFCGGA